MSREAEISSVVHMIRSRDLFEDVVEHFGHSVILRGKLANEPEDSGGAGGALLGSLKVALVDAGILNDVSDHERAVIQLTKKVKVEVLDYSNVISVSYETKSPDLARDVVAWMVNRYEEKHVKNHRPEGAFGFMKRQAEEFRKELDEKERRLEEFKIRTGMISSDLVRAELVSSIAVVQSKLRDANVDFEALNTEVNALRDGLETLSVTSLVAKTKGAGNQGVDGMRQLLYEQELNLALKSASYTEDHPTVRSLKQSVDSSKEILAQAEAQRTESVLGANPVYSEIKIELHKKIPLLLAARKRRETLQSVLQIEKNKLVQFSSNEREYRRLTRDLGLQEANYRQYIRNVAQVSVDQSLEKSSLSNISVSQPASFSEKPSRPNKLINLIAGMLLATCGSLGTAVLLAYFYDHDESSTNPFELETPALDTNHRIAAEGSA